MSKMRQRLIVEFKDRETREVYTDSLIDSTIATQIKVIREQRQWTQAQLAERAGMKQSRISAMEDVNYASWNVGTLKRLAAAFDCAIEIRFVPFSRVLDWATDLQAGSLRVRSYDDESALIDKGGDAEAATEVRLSLAQVETPTAALKMRLTFTPERTAFSTTDSGVSYGQESKTESSEIYRATGR